MKRAPLLGLGVAISILLAGCGGSPSADDTATPTRTATPTASATPSATPTPTPTPEPVPNDPADPSTWIIDGNGVGPVAIGAGRDGVGAVLPGWTLDPEQTCDNHFYGGPDGMRMTLPGDPVALIVISAPGAVPDGPHTARGIGLGSTGDQVAAAYPEVAITDDGMRTPNYAVPDNGRFVLILVPDGVVNGFFVSPYDVLPMDLC
jgi:hypothetical protein